MGYSIMTPFRTKEDKKDMLSFLEEHYDPPQFVKDYGPYLDGPTDKLSYGCDKEKHTIGFNYGCLENDVNLFVWCFCVWMAQRMGKNRKIKGAWSRYIVYDGYEFIAIEPDEKKAMYLREAFKMSPSTQDWDVQWGHDDVGFKKLNMRWVVGKLMGINVRAVNGQLKKFLKNITNEWTHEWKQKNSPLPWESDTIKSPPPRIAF